MSIFQITSGDTTVSLDSDTECNEVEQVQKLVDITVAAEMTRMDKVMDLDINAELDENLATH